MKKLVSNSMKKTVMAVAAASLLFSVSSLSAKNCDVRTFNVKVADKVSTNEILNQLSNECGFSVVNKDAIAKEKMDADLYGVNIKDMTLNEIFNTLIRSKGLTYSYHHKLLSITGVRTKTFKVDYVSTDREGSSSTDISLTGDTGNTEASSGGKGGSASSLSTGAKISSSDKFSFWASIEKELNSILNSPADKFKAPAPIINKEAGLITVSGTPSQLARVSSYMKEMMNRLHKQVMIDVKILSVTLNNQQKTGVNWGELYKLQNVKVGYDSIHAKDVDTFTDGKIDTAKRNGIWHSNLLRFSGDTSIADIIQFLNTQGKVSSISNPKVVTLNNQPAVFSSGDQLYYKLSSSSRQSGTGAATEVYSGEIVKSVFAGVLLDITPQITDDGEIILKINPSISSAKSDVKSDGVRRLPPDLTKQQISAVVKLHDGEKAVLGGLIKSVKQKGEYKVPVLGNIPVLGYAFRQDTTTEKREELVIIVTPHIITPFGKRPNRHLTLKDIGYRGIK
ncbi:MAG: pilus (MSHA type) biogenesis protein MshL [Sulfurospirillum sp.]|nr:MAG: pilus (MSHA type) biogenesis protein MshL [Sulfurospirillum sp.]